ncbi:phosphate acetyltransferase [Caproicibacterium argilliputei]|uniref:Phosphate acetyltransferase n=1 Tax=Caproicibacterium argilliputei TaxID=3030016 RepID=A0AA97DCD9_9FIRM|nr:phosphate acetyltransferase [Caproicibacterium argilliputei]WOC33254.1 phosphate acetyltransferase [Caproicibacterium argilliputei]
MLEKMIEILKKNPRKIVFPEGTDPRILEAAARLKKEGFLTPVLIGAQDAVKAAAAKAGQDITGIEIVDIAAFPDFEKMVATMVELRHGKMDEAACRASLQKSNYFGTMYVKMGYADALLGGATYSTADTVRPALQLVKCKPGHKIVTSCFLLHRPDGKGGSEMYAMGDCAINIDPNEDELVEVAQGTAETARTFGMEPKVAFLSYSTKGSGKGDSVDKMRSAAEKLIAQHPDYDVDGELQFDSAVAPAVASLKAPGSKVAGKANVFIFPDINAGNIGYKIAQRLGGFEAVGPIMAGLNAPINDLSRGCNAEEVYKMAVITAALK